MKTEKIKLTNTQKIALSFFAIILTGAILLSLPIASRERIRTPFCNSLFTATSATCVTGLAVYDTYSHWSLFGQIVILVLIQTGGLGFMSIITMFSVFLKRRITLHERRLLMQSAGNMRLSGMIKLIKKIFIGTILFEGIGAVILATKFCPEMGFFKGIYNAVFHSVSAFCNAGFDILGSYGETSLCHFYDDPTVNLTIILLVIIGGLGFLVWDDIQQNKFKFKKYSLHSKIVLCVTGGLISISFVLYFIFEYNGAFGNMRLPDKILAALFQAVTPRTAGFCTVEQSALSDSSRILTIFLMLIGGSPGSTAGGMKTTTLALLILGLISSARNSRNVVIFKRRINEHAIHQASSILVIYTGAVLLSSMLMARFEHCGGEDLLFEAASAIGTVGLSVGITPYLTVASKCILMLLMFAGRVGGLSLLLIFAEKKENPPINRPTENILIG